MALAGWTSIVTEFDRSLSHHSWKSIKIAAHPKMSPGSDQTFHLPPFKACTLLKRARRFPGSNRLVSVVAALLDEVAFFPTDDGANPDYDILDAIRPGMATIPNAMLLCASSPYAR